MIDDTSAKRLLQQASKGLRDAGYATLSSDGCPLKEYVSGQSFLSKKMVLWQKSDFIIRQNDYSTNMPGFAGEAAFDLG